MKFEIFYDSIILNAKKYTIISQLCAITENMISYNFFLKIVQHLDQSMKKA